MTTFAREKIRAALHHNTDSLHQALLDIAYDKWQTQKGWSMEDMVQYAGSFGEVVELAVLLGKYNQQVCNGGHTQYFDNGYSGTHSQDYNEGYYDYDTPLTRRLEELLLKYKLNESTTGTMVTKGIAEFINRTYSWLSLSDHNDLNEDDAEDMIPSYDDLDDAYYKINKKWMAYLEQYFKSWMEFDEDPIANNRI